MLPSGGVRVKLDLSDFVLDVGARRWILLIPGKMVTVGDLLEKIRGEYGQVKEEDTLTVFLEEQFMVPPWEPLAILKEGDLLRVTLSQGDCNLPGPSDAKRQKMERGADEKKKANRENPVKNVELKKSPIDVDKKVQTESSSSDSSSEEESRAQTVVVSKASENLKPALKKSVPAKESSSSSDSDSESEEEVEEKLKKGTVPVSNKPSLTKQTTKAESSSSEDSSSNDEEKSSMKKNVGFKEATGATSVKARTKSAQAQAKSSSDSSSSEEEKDTSKSNALKWQPVANGKCSENGDSLGKRKRKRKRKPKNKNKLSADQVPDFGPPIQPDPAIASKAEVPMINGHHRFEEEENMEVEVENMEEEEESMSAEAMKALYNKSVSVALIPPSAPVSCQSKPSQTSKGSIGGSVSCEEALLASQDHRAVSNQGVASRTYQPKPPPRVVFRPRALDVAQLKQQQAGNGAGSRFQLSSSTTAPTGMEALLSCQGQVFAKDGSEGVVNGTTAKEKDYSSFPPLEAVPGVGAMIAFKVMELSVDYTPGVSAFKEGKVLGVEGEKLFIELLAGFVKRSGGRFELGEEDTVEKNVEHGMKELIEPVLLKSA